MSKNNFYAVKNGRNNGIYDNWDECKKQIEGHSGALYKGFSDYQSAYNFLYGEYKDADSIDFKKNIKEAEAYVDGSYSKENKLYSYGCIILYENEVIKFSGTGNDEEYLIMNNVGGELFGAIMAIEWAYDNNCSSITIYHDYEGIERWANGTWETNKQGTKEYLDFIKRYRKYMVINFKKVQAHSGNLFNEEADMLAKQALNGNIKYDDKNKRIDTFNKIMNTKEINKNSFNFMFKSYRISENKLKKFVKEIWCLEGNKKSDISIINLYFNMQNSIMEWNIVDTEGKTHDFKMKID